MANLPFVRLPRSTDRSDRIIPKLNAEAEVQLGPGGPANVKRGTLDVHRGGARSHWVYIRGSVEVVDSGLV